MSTGVPYCKLPFSLDTRALDSVQDSGEQRASRKVFSPLKCLSAVQALQYSVRPHVVRAFSFVCGSALTKDFYER